MTGSASTTRTHEAKLSTFSFFGIMLFGFKMVEEPSLNDFSASFQLSRLEDKNVRRDEFKHDEPASIQFGEIFCQLVGCAVLFGPSRDESRALSESIN